MVTFEVEKGFSYLFTEEMCHRHPEGMIVENGMFSLMKDDVLDRVIQADDPVNGPYTKLGPPLKPIFDHHCEVRRPLASYLSACASRPRWSVRSYLVMPDA